MSTAAGKSRTLARRLRVVVVDDDPETVVSLLAVLRAAGHDVQGYGSGQAALKAMREFVPDVVISDLAMPAVSGFDLARQVRKSAGRPDRPLLIAISGAYTESDDRVLMEQAGFDHHLPKPCDHRRLLELIRQLG